MSDQHEKAIADFRRGLWARLAVRDALMFCAAWGFIWGTAVLVTRAMGGEAEPLLWGGAGMVVAILAAGLIAYRRLPKVSAVRALIDGQGGCGGLVMAAEETDTAAWRERLPKTQAPLIRWNGSKQFSLFLAAGVYLAIGFLVPQDYFNITRADRLNIDEQADRLAEQIQALKEENILEEKEAELLEEQVEKVKKEASAQDPIKTWEALDSLEEKLARSAQEEANDALSQQEKMNEAQALAEALHEDQQQPNPMMEDKLLAEAMRHLAEQVKEMMKESDWLKEALEKENVNSDSLSGPASETGELTEAQMEALSKLAASIKSGKAAKINGFKKLKDVRLIDAAMLAKLCEGGKPCDKEGLIAYLCENCNGNCSVKEAMACNRPGKGGLTRGRGDAAMTWRDPTSEEGAKFKEEALPMDQLSALDEANLIGVTTGAPEVTDPSEAGTSQSVALGKAKAGGGSANRQTILPRHREAVSKYFDRD